MPSFTTLISARELAPHIQSFNPNWIILDCRHDLAVPDAGRTAYTAGHIPTAQFAHLDLDLSSKTADENGKFRGRHPLPDQEKFIETMRNWGVNDGSQVIAYDAHGGMFAARLWWMLRWVGHSAVAVLDGGIAAWIAQGLPLSTENSVNAKGNISIKPSVVKTVNADDILSNLQSHSRIVIDARAPDRYRGENETIDPVGGHIPGAKNRFFKDNLQTNGQFKLPAQLRDEFSALIDDPIATIMQCGSGVTACHNLLAMEIGGLSGAALYPGSWSEWCSDINRPVKTGAEA